MDVNVNAEVKTVGVPTTMPAVEREDRVKPQVTPVAQGVGSDRVTLKEKGQPRREEDRKRDALKGEELSKAVEDIQERLDVMGTRLNLAISKDPDAVVVKVTDRKTGELVRQIPSEDVLQLRKQLLELTGLLFDEKA
ncbi:MAG: flagellar protein FlaG [Thermodesulfobacteriota bacterium]